MAAAGRTAEQQPGDAAGTCTTPVQIGPGDAVEADFGVLGRVTARFAPAR